MNKQEIYRLLEERRIRHAVVEHPAAYTVEDIVRMGLPHPERGARNLFVRDDKKRAYYLLVVKDDTPVSLRAVQGRIGSRRLSFASEVDLADKLGLARGAVTPLGVLSDEARCVRVFLDSYFCGGDIWVHPNDNTASVLMATADLESLIRDHGNAVEYVDFSALGA